MRVFITGATGQLGYSVCKVLAERGVDHMGTSSKELDITDGMAVYEMLSDYRPNAVVHCAAYTTVDKAEDEKERCFAVNEGGTRNIAMACKAIDAKLIYISTDYVFSGIGEQYHETDDPTRPLSVYGKSKLSGELAVRETLSEHFIVRTSWVFGINGKNFIKNMLRLAETHDSLTVVSDQIGSPTYTADLAPLLCDMIETEKYGTYHATNEGVCSWAELAEEVFSQTCKDVKVTKITTAEYCAKAARPLNSRMSKAKLNEAGFLRLPDWHDAVCRYLRVLNNKKHVLVTGGTGNIGRYVVKKLLDSGYSVTVATTHPEAVGDGVGVCTEPIFSGAQDIYERVGKPDVCIHMAWHDGFVHNSPAHMASLSDHITFCKNMMEGGLPVLSCMGTMHEVGYWEGAIDENTPCNPQTQYGIAKNAMRQSLLIASKNTGCTLHWLRLFYIVTNDKKGSNIFSKIMRAAQEGQARFPFTSGKNLYDFMKIDELVRSIVFVSVQTEVSGVTNVCTGKPESLASCVERFIKEQQLDICLDYGKFPDRTYDSPGVWGDASKINSIMSRVSDKCSVVGKKEC